MKETKDIRYELNQEIEALAAKENLSYLRAYEILLEGKPELFEKYNSYYTGQPPENTESERVDKLVEAIAQHKKCDYVEAHDKLVKTINTQLSSTSQTILLMEKISDGDPELAIMALAYFVNDTLLDGQDLDTVSKAFVNSSYGDAAMQAQGWQLTNGKWERKSQ